MDKRKLAFIVTAIGIIIIIFITSIIHIININIEKEYNFVEVNIIKNTKRCISDNKCNKEDNYLTHLKQKGYIKDLINPKTKKNFDISSYVSYPEYKLITKGN
ncbi:MAG: hypothetical protein RSB41_02330 [Bacilli bacterium]